MKAAFLGLGSNLGNGPQQIRQAVALLDAFCPVQRVSTLYRSPPWGRREQPPFINAVAKVTTELSAERLLQVLLDIEHTLGRRRTSERWAPRPIDLDLLLFGRDLISKPHLVVPHPWMHCRAFVLVPLLELEPDIDIPGLGRAADCLARLDRDEVSMVQPCGAMASSVIDCEDVESIVKHARSDSDE